VLLLLFFIRDRWMQDAASAAGTGGWSALNQLGIQVMGLGTAIAPAVIGTLVICFIVEKTIGFRMDGEREVAGLDHSLHGEYSYGLIQVLRKCLMN
jgi:Amt family ammonium transporter